jgi:carbamoyl-phosphate synthase large subunit
MAGQGVELFAADVNRYASGLYLVPEGNRLCLPPGESPDFLPAVIAACARHRIDVLVPTMDDELLRLAEARSSLARLGTEVMVAAPRAVAPCLDLLALTERFRGQVPVPKTAVLDATLRPTDFRFPLVMRWRQPGQEPGMHLILDPHDLESVARDSSFVIQEYLGGVEYEVQILGTQEGEIRGVVPVASLGANPSWATARRTVRNDLVDRMARKVYTALGLTGPACVRLREDRKGRPHLIGVHARVGAGVQLAAAAGVPIGPHAVRDLLGMPCGPVARPILEVASVTVVREELVPLHALDAQVHDLAPRSMPSSDLPDNKLASGKVSVLLH